MVEASIFFNSISWKNFGGVELLSLILNNAIVYIEIVYEVELVMMLYISLVCFRYRMLCAKL